MGATRACQVVPGARRAQTFSEPNEDNKIVPDPLPCKQRVRTLEGLRGGSTKNWIKHEKERSPKLILAGSELAKPSSSLDEETRIRTRPGEGPEIAELPGEEPLLPTTIRLFIPGGCTDPVATVMVLEPTMKNMLTQQQYETGIIWHELVLTEWEKECAV